MIVCNEDYATGIRAVDRRHQLWICQINRLEALLATPSRLQTCIQVARPVGFNPAVGVCA